jgi:hypothetical protein
MSQSSTSSIIMSLPADLADPKIVANRMASLI